MKADVVQVSYHEGQEWHTWPFRPSVKPSNVELLCADLGAAHALWANKVHGVAIKFHAIRLSDGAEWDSYKGFRSKEWSRPH